MYKTLKEVSTLIDDGDWIESKDQSEKGIWLIQTGNVGINELKYKENSKHYISEETFERLKCKEVLSGDILISRLPDPVGRSCLLELNGEKAITAVDCTILRINEKIINKRYLINYLNSNVYFDAVNANVTGATRKRISRKKLENIPIKVYELSEQSKIADELDRIIDVMTNNSKIIANLNGLKQSIFFEKFGDINKNPNKYEMTTLEKICSSIVRGPFGSSLKKEFFVEKGNNTYKVYEQKNAIQANCNIGEYYLDEKKFQELKRFECKSGDIIMSCSGTIGKLYELPIDCEKGIINQALCKFTLSDKITSNYFVSFMGNIIEQLNTKGSSIKNIGAVSYIKNLELLLPPIDIQLEFENSINSINESITKIEQQNIKLKELYDLKCYNYFK